MTDFINLHTHSRPDEKNVTAIVNQYPNESVDSSGFYSIGIHPWFIDLTRLNADLKVIEEKISDHNCIAVGECGLDKNREHSLEVQTEIFKSQLEIAEKYKKPVIIHCVGAFQELVAIKSEMKITVPMVVHGFRKHAQLGQELLDHGFYLSFGKNLIQNPDYAETFADMPNHKIFLETDSAEFEIDTIYDVAAKYKGISSETLQKIIAQNFITVFRQKF